MDQRQMIEKAVKYLQWWHWGIYIALGNIIGQWDRDELSGESAIVMLIALLVVAVNKYGVNVQSELMEVNDQLAGRSPELKVLLRENVLPKKDSLIG